MLIHLRKLLLLFTLGKKIFLLNDIYEPFIDELTAWESVPLKNDMEKLIVNKHMRRVKDESYKCM